MLKYVQCVKAQSDIELYEFRQYWNEYCSKFREWLKSFGLTRVHFSTTLAVEDNLKVMVERGTREPYDGMIQVFFENAESLRQLTEAPEFQTGLTDIQAMQEEFIDLERSTFFFAMDDRPEPE